MKKVIIIGAGPAGLTAALELAQHTNIKPIILESLSDVGGISRTIEYRGNRMDIGGHRFFSKSDWVMNWWREMMPVAPEKDLDGYSRLPENDRHLLIRPRISRIYFLRKFFDYPVRLSIQTMRNLGGVRLIKIIASYIKSSLFSRYPEKNLEDFFCNRFGNALYRTFFKDYTEKVWGVSCQEISPAWGAQRIKGLSIIRSLQHAFRQLLIKKNKDIAQKKTETSLIEKFLYPKLGPGQMWKFAAEELTRLGGKIYFEQTVVQIEMNNGRVNFLTAVNKNGENIRYEVDELISSMAVKDLVMAIAPAPPSIVSDVAEGLIYRDFITMGLLVKKLKPTTAVLNSLNLLPDTWIYIQEPDVKIGRLQIFNNWCPALVKDENTVWLGLEYFCQEGDDLWLMNDVNFSKMAIDELVKIGLIEVGDVLDYHVERIPKAYPAYFGTYGQFDIIRKWADEIPNLFMIGRNGMHRYNNQDHSMLTAKLAAEAISKQSKDKSAIWSVNVEEEYHEEQYSKKDKS